MLRGNVEQTDNLPLLLPRYMHAQLQTPQQRARTVQALPQDGMERTLFGLHQRADIGWRHRLIEPSHRSAIARHLFEPPRPIFVVKLGHRTRQSRSRLALWKLGVFEWNS